MAGPKQKWCSIVNVSSGESKVPCSKQQYCIGTWNIVLMNQGKSDVVKQKMARVNIDILGISELKWTWLGEFNSDNLYIYYCGQESFRRNGAGPLINKKSPKCSNWVQSHKQQNDLCSFPRQTIQYHSNPSLCPKHYCQRCWSWPVLWRPTRPPISNTKKKSQVKDFLFIIKN